jgi:hypothetical protein
MAPLMRADAAKRSQATRERTEDSSSEKFQP